MHCAASLCAIGQQKAATIQGLPLWLEFVLPSAFIKELRRTLPAKAIIEREAAMKPFETDALTAKKELPGVVVLPGSQEEVRAVLAVCRAHEVPVVARGAGTGLSGGARPVRHGVLLGMSRMSRILEVDAQNRCARVQPGVTNLAVSEAAREFGLYYAPDPSSQLACSIGGNVAENSGGVHCLKYGLTVHNILGLTLLTIDGEKLEIGGARLDSPGYDLLALVNGSEGMLGIVVEACLRLLPIPEYKSVLLGGFAKTGAAARVVNSILSQGIVPAGLEMMDKLAIHAAEDYAHAGYPLDVEAILLVELDGPREEVESLATRVNALFHAEGASRIDLATDPEDMERLWRGRKAAFPAMGRLAPDYYCMDGTIPRRALEDVLRRIDELSRQYGLRVANVFHAGDGNLHPLILYDASQTGELEKAEALGGEILKVCVEVGGTVTGEHGVGVEKLDQMCVQFSSKELAQFHALKSAFDDRALLNPGKAVPTLARCAELGGMHVHGGRLPHPELERL